MPTAKPVVLVIDDDPTHLYLTRSLLEDEGLQVHCHEGAFGATQRLRDVEPDLVLLDVNMPGLSGETLAGILRRAEQRRASWAGGAPRGAPIVLYSSNDEDVLRQSVSALGVAGYVCKGDLGMLRERVWRVLGTWARGA
ncbi:response regulator [Anaeromyxobacter paludicola]|uniref:Response regulator n=1 Tax=Anaeromyxobacter paludicola TaxID=2918171 RepID=A0ABM7XBT6_9BACT|nr:response regulator [Anaeromyxobacter paludicola]BDG09322.1 response regulator [Anaeromyxobacter paludicola]